MINRRPMGWLSGDLGPGFFFMQRHQDCIERSSSLYEFQVQLMDPRELSYMVFE